MVQLETGELVFDSDRQIHYHWVRSQITDPNQSDEYKTWLRDYKISEINDESLDPFSYEERLKIELLRIETHFDKNKKKFRIGKTRK